MFGGNLSKTESLFYDQLIFDYELFEYDSAGDDKAYIAFFASGLSDHVIQILSQMCLVLTFTELMYMTFS